MVKGEKVRESLTFTLKDWCIYSLDFEGLFGGLCFP
jgi:hypothetical protein